ncbi:MAG: putative RDD family membrane protein YckC [Enterobacterales bacterium]|jgi:uncharacterized RDD family membrane protein YckC
MNDASTLTPYPAGFFRRLAALVYDSLVVTAILILTTAIVMIVVAMFMGETAITEQNILVENPLYFSCLVATWFYYYAWCWRTGGQTLGMKAWRLKLVSNDNLTISYKNALIRFSSSLLGLANLGVLLPSQRGWHDRLSHTDIVVIDKNA